MAGSPTAFQKSAFQNNAFQIEEVTPPPVPPPIILPSIQPFPQFAGSSGPGPGPASGPPFGKRAKQPGGYKSFRAMSKPGSAGASHAKFKKPPGYTKH